MQIRASYKAIWQMAYPIIVGSFAQNFIGVTDIIFLGYVGQVEFAAVGIISIYYLVMVMIGFGISRGGQILIARRDGEKKYKEIGSITYNLLYVEMLVALILFLFLQFLSPYVLWLFIHSVDIYDASMEYIFYRSFGLFFSFFGFVLMALYTGIGRTKIIALITTVLFVSNVCLNYTLIFGKFGMPAMGIGGAGLASTFAEIISTIIGMFFILRDKQLLQYGVDKFHKLEVGILQSLANLSTPVVFQYFISMGGWFLLFSLIESMGQKALAISTALRHLYSFYSIPAWGFASAVNSIVSNLIGQNQSDKVFTAINRTAVLSFILTVLACVTLAIFPETILSVFLDKSLIKETKPILFMLIGIIMVGSVAVVIFNGLIGTGAVRFGLAVQIFSVALYLTYAFTSVKYMELELSNVWSSEFLYWVAMALPAWAYLQSDRWRNLDV